MNVLHRPCGNWKKQLSKSCDGGSGVEMKRPAVKLCVLSIEAESMSVKIFGSLGGECLHLDKQQ